MYINLENASLTNPDGIQVKLTEHQKEKIKRWCLECAKQKKSNKDKKAELYWDGIEIGMERMANLLLGIKKKEEINYFEKKEDKVIKTEDEIRHRDWNTRSLKWNGTQRQREVA